MWIVRSAETRDVDELYRLALSLGSGMTTFPADRDALAAKAAAAAQSFSGRAREEKAQYLLTLEDTETRSILGVSAVYPHIGIPHGFFSYHVDRLVQHSLQFEFNLDCRVLALSNVYTGLTEIGTLAVRNDARRGGAGALLSRARFMLMACFPQLFAERVIAEMRGWQSEEGLSPFWSAVGERFFRTDFPTADTISAIHGARWIADLMPKFPIYVDLLPAEARQSIGRPHQSSAIAMQMLQREGFRYEGYVDVFDAGPQIVAPLAEINTMRASRNGTLRIGAPTADAQLFLIATTNLERFRLVRAPAEASEQEIIVSESTARALGATIGDVVRYVSA